MNDMRKDDASTMHVIGSLHGGGAERLLTNLVTQQQADRERGSVVCLYPGGVFRRTLEAEGIEVLDLGMRHASDTVGGLLKLAALLRERRPAVVQSWMYGANVFASLALGWAGRGETRLIWGIFCSDVDASAYPWRSHRLHRGVARLFSAHVDGIVYNASQARDFHRSIGFREPRSLVIPNCLDIHTFRPDPSARATVRRELGIADEAVVVVMAARADPMKDWRGVRTAVDGLPGVVTVAIGEGTERLTPQPGFIGLGWRDDVARIFSGADMFLLGSAFGEGTSLALAEAMACGLPCVVTEVGGNGALVGSAGIVVPPRRSAALRAAILELAGDKARREELGRAARARMIHGHSADEIAAMLKAFTASAMGAA
jgi:glycosyltransferase involved in cell wall biosynthesis